MRLGLELLAERYGDSVYSAAFSVLRNRADAEDAAQDTFLRYHVSDREFESEEHIRAWLLRVAINRAKSMTVAFWRRNKEPLDDYAETLSFEEQGDRELFDAVMALPERYRLVLHLHYFEGYSVEETALILGVRPGTVKSQLSRGRALLRKELGEDGFDE